VPAFQTQSPEFKPQSKKKKNKIKRMINWKKGYINKDMDTWDLEGHASSIHFVRVLLEVLPSCVRVTCLYYEEPQPSPSVSSDGTRNSWC
jgi:hypothetical protein